MVKKAHTIPETSKLLKMKNPFGAPFSSIFSGYMWLSGVFHMSGEILIFNSFRHRPWGEKEPGGWTSKGPLWNRIIRLFLGIKAPNMGFSEKRNLVRVFFHPSVSYFFWGERGLKTPPGKDRWRSLATLMGVGLSWPQNRPRVWICQRFLPSSVEIREVQGLNVLGSWLW